MKLIKFIGQLGCKKYGTLPFAGLARCGFVGVELLNSLQKLELYQKMKK